MSNSVRFCPKLTLSNNNFDIKIEQSLCTDTASSLSQFYCPSIQSLMFWGASLDAMTVIVVQKRIIRCMLYPRTSYSLYFLGLCFLTGLALYYISQLLFIFDFYTILKTWPLKLGVWVIIVYIPIVQFILKKNQIMFVKRTKFVFYLIFHILLYVTLYFMIFFYIFEFYIPYLYINNCVAICIYYIYREISPIHLCFVMLLCFVQIVMTIRDIIIDKITLA